MLERCAARSPISARACQRAAPDTQQRAHARTGASASSLFAKLKRLVEGGGAAGGGDTKGRGSSSRSSSARGSAAQGTPQGPSSESQVGGASQQRQQQAVPTFARANSGGAVWPSDEGGSSRRNLEGCHSARSVVELDHVLMQEGGAHTQRALLRANSSQRQQQQEEQQQRHQSAPPSQLYLPPPPSSSPPPPLRIADPEVPASWRRTSGRTDAAMLVGHDGQTGVVSEAVVTEARRGTVSPLRDAPSIPGMASSASTARLSSS